MIFITTTNRESNNIDYSPIYETLKEFYPLDNNISPNEIKDFEGLNKINQLIDNNFINRKNYKEIWGKLKSQLKKVLNEQINEINTLSEPCYTGYIVIQKQTINNITHQKELHFFISLLGPYFTIIGIDKCNLTLEEEMRSQLKFDRVFSSNLALTVSPYLEFETQFLKLQNSIKNHYPELKFIPYSINNKKLEGISLIHTNSDFQTKDTIFSGLFKPENYFNASIRGNINYGQEDWII